MSFVVFSYSTCSLCSNVEFLHLCMQEIWHHIISLMPMRDAARAACVSHAFQSSWRCHPNLTFTEETMFSKESFGKWMGDSNDKRYIREYNRNVGNILESHRGAGVKALELELYGPCNTKSYNRLNSWLQIAITPVLEELTLLLLSGKAKYDFPCSILSERSGNTIRYLILGNCVLRPTINLGLRCLTKLDLYEVRITGDELGRFLSNSFALEKIKLAYCDDIIRLEIPCLLQQLSCLTVFGCSGLQVIEIKAPNVYNRRAISYAIDKLSSSLPNLETLTLHSHREIVGAPMVPSKFLHLKVLSISIRNWSNMGGYDFLSLVSLLDASPSLETFGLSVSVERKYHLIVGDPSTLRQIPEHRHDSRLKDVKVTGFCPQKSLVELTRHILESAMSSLKCLILDTIHEYHYRCSGNKPDMKCSTLRKAYIKKVHKSVTATKTYIEGKVPSTAELSVLGPCSRCHAL
uniref:Uncharacterized protein n=1 Tax=Avena sativa TaxID=4498 RepID=A0ACD5Y042_AVESA